MKTRTGFVSNSSSSSFIVVFPKKPESDEEVKKFMFNGMNGQITWHCLEKESLSYQNVSEIVAGDIENKKIATKKEIAEELGSLLYYERYYFKEALRKDEMAFVHYMSEDIMSEEEMLDLTKQEIEIEKSYREQQKSLWQQFTTTESRQSEDFQKREREITDKYFKKLNPVTDKIFALINKISEQKAQEFIDDHEGWWYTILSYSDNDGRTHTMMEHADVFRHVEHIRISHH